MLRQSSIGLAIVAATLALGTNVLAAESATPSQRDTAAANQYLAQIFTPMPHPAAPTGAAGNVQIASVTDRRTFQPNFSSALTPAQLDAAWNVEVDRVFGFGPAHHSP